MQSTPPSKNNPNKWKKKSLRDQDASVRRLAAWNCIANASLMAESALKSVAAVAVGIRQAMRRKFWRQKCWRTIGIRGLSRVFQHTFRCVSARARSPDARRSTVSVTMRVWSARSGVNAGIVRTGVSRRVGGTNMRTEWSKAWWKLKWGFDW